MASTAISAQGTLFYVTTDEVSPATFAAVSNVKSLKGIDGSAKEIDVTNFDSAAVEIVLGLADNGSLQVEMDLDNANSGQAALQAAKESGAIKLFKFVLPAGTTPTATFNGYVKKFDVSTGVNDVVKRMCDIRISGAVTWS